MPSSHHSEPLTRDMIVALRDEAAAMGDYSLVDDCEAALGGNRVSAKHVAAVITSARAADDSRDFVSVVAD